MADITGFGAREEQRARPPLQRGDGSELSRHYRGGGGLPQLQLLLPAAKHDMDVQTQGGGSMESERRTRTDRRNTADRRQSNLRWNGPERRQGDRRELQDRRTSR